jgi:hypothetical protein
MKLSGELHIPAGLLPGEDPLVPLDRNLGGLQCQFEHGGEEKTLNQCQESKMTVHQVVLR